MGNPNHDQRGRFASGNGAAASGDHLQAQPSNKNLRRVPGHPGGVVPRSKVVAAHNGADSVGVSNGVGAGTGGVRLSAKEEKIAMSKAVDARRYPTRSNAHVTATTDLGKPIQSITATPGRFDAREMGRKLIGG
jgi:hypothetical protein